MIEIEGVFEKEALQSVVVVEEYDGECIWKMIERLYVVE